MRLSQMLVEAKLTEGDFQKAEKKVLERYRDFQDVFEKKQLPQSDTHYFSYQLLRNVLAAHATQNSFCVFVDARRPDLIEAWYAVMRCVQPMELRTRLRVLTWQELCGSLSPQLQEFLAAKYGIDPEHVGALGGSAGGHLVLMLGVTAGVEEFEGSGPNREQSSRVQCVRHR